MDSSILSISEILNDIKSFLSAGFSAGYSFDAINADEYFDELLENSIEETPIFSGILILEKHDKKITIVDGLQRMTTICLLLIALCEKYKDTSKNNEETRKKIYKRYLLTSPKKPKLNLGAQEQEIYKKILFGQELSKEEQTNNLSQTYFMFLQKIKEHKISGTELFRIISKIKFMVVYTNKSEVSTKELYQVLNTNKTRSQVNLISDFLNKKDPAAGKLWQRAVNIYRELDLQQFLDSFIKDFLTVQNEGDIPNQNALFNKFKSYYTTISQYKNANEVADNMVKYSKYYLQIINSDFEDEEIRNKIIVLNENNGHDTYSYLMEVLDDYSNKRINRSVFLDILDMINSIISRRNDGDDMRIDFATLSKELNKMLIFPDYSSYIIDESKLTINDLNKLSTSN